MRKIRVGRAIRTEQLKKCAECGGDFVTVWARQKICVACRPVRGRAESEKSVAARKASKNKAIAEIHAVRGKQKSRLSELPLNPDHKWSACYSVPFSGDASKNRRWSNNGQGAVYLSQGVRNYQDFVIARTRRAIEGIDVRQNKLWIGLIVEKPNHYFDAINVVDTICDAIKIATDLDDRWFCISYLDWQIKKTDPSILISLSQEDEEDVIVCSHCGEIKGVKHYNKHAGNPLGRSRACRDCRKIIHKAEREERAKL